ncbi:MAG TPA: ATP-binding protein [Terriglobales bacterium]|nr:ATP-binding protein [Terriglobales bacterium]
MPETEPIRGLSRWKRLTHSIGAKLILSLLAAMVGIFALLGYLNTRLHRQHLEAATLTSAERVSDVIKRSTTYYMLRNDREGLYHVMATIADEPGMVRVRIFDRDGRISYSTDPSEVSHIVDKAAEACYGCHAQSQPLTRLNRPDRFRVYRNGGGQRVLGVITPIENQPACSNAACHAHPAGQQILGVLDTSLSLAKADAQLAQSSRIMWLYDGIAMLTIAVFIGAFVWREVASPLKKLKAGTERLAKGELGYQIEVQSHDEVGDLAESFNGMSLQLRRANEEIVSWARHLEERVDQKTRELKRTLEEVLHVEKMASIGKMAAVVAHEINNPLSGILTYAKLLRKWLDRGQADGDKKQDALQCVDLIAAESRRCGDLVKNLLTFSRTAPMNVESTDINAVVNRCVMLVRHQMELGGVQLQLELAEGLPRVQCDGAQIEQVLLALVMNAIDALPRGGNLWLKTRLSKDARELEFEVRDDGVGIAPEILPRMFEPFLTTKESGHGVGLGLAVSRSIIERHSGRIEVQSEVGKGTTFVVRLQLGGKQAVAAVAAETAGVQAR